MQNLGLKQNELESCESSMVNILTNLIRNAPSPDIVIGGLQITNEMDLALISLAVLETIMPNYGKNYNIY